MPVVLVGVTALVLPTQRDHSSDADIGLGLLVPHPRPFRWWIFRGGGLSHGLRSLALALVPFVLGFRSWVLRPYPIFPLPFRLRPMKSWGGVGI